MKILAVIKLELMEHFRDRSSWIIKLILPVVLTLILVNIGNNESLSKSEDGTSYPIGIVSGDYTAEAEKFIGKVREWDKFHITEGSLKDINEKVAEGSLSLGLYFMEQSEPGLEVAVVTVNRDNVYFSSIMELQTVFDRMSVEEMAKEQTDLILQERGLSDKGAYKSDIDRRIEEIMEEPPILTVEKINPFSRGEGDLDEEERTDLHYSVGMIVMFLMFTIMGSAGVVLKEKKLNTWTRVLSVPTETNLFLTGRMMGSFIIGWLQIIIMLGFGHFVLNINFGNSLFLSFLILTVYMFSISGLGIFLGNIIESYAQLNSILTVVIISSSMLSGCYWPVWLMPGFMKKTALIFPQYWGIQALELTMGSTGSIRQIFIPLLMLCFFGVIFLILSFFAARKVNIEGKGIYS